MTESMERAGVSRRWFLGGVGVTAGGLMVASGPVLWQQAAKADTVTAEQVHLTFGADPAREVVVSWVTPTAVSNPAVILGTTHGGFGRTIHAETRTYTDSNNGVETLVQHARLEGLHPDTDYVYKIVSGGETQVSSAFRTAPEGRVPFRFTSVGDIACGDTAYSKASLNAMATAATIESFNPVVHVVNGDLSYANSNQLFQPQVWEEYFDNTQLSSANRPWMPTLGNHENEPGNGPQGYLSYQTRFALPKNDSGEFEGNWYSFQVGSVLFVMLDNNDVCYQIDTGTYPEHRRQPDPDRLLRRRAAEVAGEDAARGVDRLHRSTGSSPSCTSRPCPPPTRTAPTSASGRTGCRCSTSTASTSCWPATTTTTSAATRCAAPTPAPSCGRTSSAPT